jgi:hypothetical protein
MNLEDELYDDYDDYDDYDYDEEEDINEAVQVAYNPSIHKPSQSNQINQIKQIVPKPESEIKKALQEGGSVEKAIDLLLQGKNLMIFWGKEAKCSFVLDYHRKFEPKKINPFERVFEMQVDELETGFKGVTITPKVHAPAVKQEKPPSLGLRSSAKQIKIKPLTTKQSLSSLQKKPNGIQLSSLSKTIKTTAKPVFSLSQLKESKPIIAQAVIPQKSFQFATPSEHGLFLSTNESPQKNTFSIQLTL